MSMKFRAIEAYVKWNIDSGVYKPLTKIPSENELAIKHDCSRLTARKALQLLIDDGVIFSQKGKGYFVSAKISNPKFQNKFEPKSFISRFYKSTIKFDASNRRIFKDINVDIDTAFERKAIYMKEYYDNTRNIFSINHSMVNLDVCRVINLSQAEKSFALYLNKNGIVVSKKIEKINIIEPNVMLALKLKTDTGEKVVANHVAMYDVEGRMISIYVKYTKLSDYNATFETKYL